MVPIILALTLGVTPADPLASPAPAADRGEVRTGPPLTHTFELVHAGPAPIIITGVESACGCLKPTVSKNNLQPGERAAVTVTVNTLTQPPGANTWTTRVRYRAAAATPSVLPDAELELKLSAKLIREVSVTPPSLAVSTSSEATQTLTVSDVRAAPLTVLSAATTSPHMTATVRAATTADGVRSQAVELTVTKAYPPGQAVDEAVVLRTNDPGCPELRVPVKVTKRAASDVVASPEQPEVRFARGQAEASVLVQVRRPDGKAVRIAKVECDHAAVRGRWPDDAVAVAAVRLSVDAAKACGRSGEAVVKVTLADPPGRELVVPLKWSLPE
jgi:hypothetical protein